MPTFTAIALDRLIEPGTTRSMASVRNPFDSEVGERLTADNSRQGGRVDGINSKPERGVGLPPNPNLERGISLPANPKLDNGVSIPPTQKQERGISCPPIPNFKTGVRSSPNGKLERGVSLPPNPRLERGVNFPSSSNLDRRNGSATSAALVGDTKHHWTQISPALYATPKSTPLPDSPSSFPPSPYIINHKRRGPRLVKSFSEDNVATCEQPMDGVKLEEDAAAAAENDVESASKSGTYVLDEVLESAMGGKTKMCASEAAIEEHSDGVSNDKPNNLETGPTDHNGVMKAVTFNMQQDNELDNSVNRQDSVSVRSTGESDFTGEAERSLNPTTPIAEFYDAWEELSSDSGLQLSLPYTENELREIRLSLLTEIEKRKQAEDTLNIMKDQWQRISHQLSLAGLALPAITTTFSEGEQSADPATDICQQVYLLRFVSNSIARGIAKAEVEVEMEAQINLKNFEIARLLDRLHYYEAVNQEMSQRNQEVVETARRLRQRRRRRQKWIWGSVAAASILGSAFMAYSYFQSGKCPSPNVSDAPEIEHQLKGKNA